APARALLKYSSTWSITRVWTHQDLRPSRRSSAAWRWSTSFIADMGTALHAAPAPTRTSSRRRATHTWKEISRAWTLSKRRPWSRKKRDFGFRMSDVGCLREHRKYRLPARSSRNPKSDILLHIRRTQIFR